MRLENSSPNKKWIASAVTDLTFILSPPFLVTALVILFPSLFNQTEVPIWAWVVFVLLIDVAHVYSTLYRTYFDPEELKSRPVLYATIPIGCYLIGVLLFTFGASVFWRVLAYVAVFHFVRQQYGFLVIYARKSGAAGRRLLLDKTLIYLSTIYPLVYWHTHPRSFSWFVEQDFVSLSQFSWSSSFEMGCFYLYLIVALAYVIKETRYPHEFSLGKNLLILGTALSWYVGIVLYNGDLAFTMTNVVSHGVPYIALIWMYGRKRSRRSHVAVQPPFLSRVFQVSMLPMFLGILVLFAYFEEGLWDALVWRERAPVFDVFYALPQVSDHLLLSLIVPLLILPQATHYVLDGFIWKSGHEGRDLAVLVGTTQK